jgi:hypothetical protein
MKWFNNYIMFVVKVLSIISGNYTKVSGSVCQIERGRVADEGLFASVLCAYSAGQIEHLLLLRERD